MKKSFSSFIAVAGIAVALQCNTACNNAGNKATGSTDSATTATPPTDSLATAKKKKIAMDFQIMEANLPDHFDVIKDISSRQIPFKQELINASANADAYTTTLKKEVNMGIYAVDLMYVNYYSKNQDLLNYFGVLRKLAKDLQFDNVFDKYAQRFQSNADKKDTVVEIVNGVFNQTDDYLNKNDRYVDASHIFAGSMIEVCYLSLNLINSVKKAPDYDKLLERVYNENRTIFDLINLFEESTDEGSKTLLAGLKAYKQAYDQVIKAPTDLTHDNVAKVMPSINEIRNKMTAK